MLWLHNGLTRKDPGQRSQLRDQGYRAGVGPVILPMQYQITSEPMLGTSIYKLVWNEPDTGTSPILKQPFPVTTKAVLHMKKSGSRVAKDVEALGKVLSVLTDVDERQ